MPPSPAHLTVVPARDLRPGDLVPAAGDGVRVHAAPELSACGETVTVMFTEPATGARRPARLPVTRPLRVQRVVAAGDGHVRVSKVARSTGTRVRVLDLTHPDSPIPARGREVWATECTVHGQVRRHLGVSTAEGMATHPEEWCTSCTQVARDRALARVTGPNGLRRAG